ncbi:halocyanin [Haloferax mediterranei ATCC 33500]|uniref:Halocyanin n=1 Tax=Haloferax mediterranei (strain ATCC 33500 / DSM 1411 / JCM 8866 / NBRC 14739 / NCIMB 2177 / R-4) TaxID=523841 RepID=I3R3R2_HALMT|nr:plastocyanin/azurin family copper-binding protein [Haloferax mediterranei]AFK18872.1 halocyanin hcpH [Haloferax mediterranei ATCC 33500]AHZ21765.1 halocyanin [Haloferax mediterranei ATCC 33500]EMA03270.1 halocyanin hcpH [Haloferax mediterranei ATCC 33500]MDX5988965.1 plastocyanin/azurin family copper-binding protein [Haloferax mediterranei ATCC 33500]QCQ75358.1 halocyanin [Haloferax mediterranei ATCC 33500]
MRDDGSSDGRQTRRRFLAATGTVVTASLSGCSTSLASGDDFDVGMTATAFDPPTVTVEVGDEVVWRNTSSRGHTVTAYEGTLPEGAEFFASGGFEDEETARNAYSNSLGGLIKGRETYSHTFEVAGEYEYLCIPHEQQGMVGTIVVEE